MCEQTIREPNSLVTNGFMDGHRDTELYILSVSTDTHTVLHIHFSKITFIFGKQGLSVQYRRIGLWPEWTQTNHT